MSDPLQDPYGLSRFVQAQASAYAQALVELRAGRKRSHWILVIVRTGTTFHGVLLPTFEDDESAARYLRFMNTPSPQIALRAIHFSGDHWEMSKQCRYVNWPDANWK